MNTQTEEAPLAVDFMSALRQQWILAGLIDPNAPMKPAKPVLSEEQEAERIRALIRAQRLAAFKESCPREFRSQIERARIPNAEAWDKADAWTGGYPGVWLWSEQSGRCKTRMLWRQFGRMHVGRGRSVLKVGGHALAEEYFAYHMAGKPRAFYHWVMAYDVVMIDDLDKMDLEAYNARAPRMCRELFDHLYEHHKPTLVTANEPIEHFAQRIGPSTARRMNEVCCEIRF